MKIKKPTFIYSGSRGILRMIMLAVIMWGASGAFAVAPQEAVKIFSETPRLPAGSMAVLVSELPSGRIIASYNSDTPLVPASIMKCISLASLSENADVEKPIETPVYITGSLGADGVLHGDILVEAKGDPSINSTVWPLSEDLNDEIVKALRKNGVKSVEGSIRVDQSYFSGTPIPSSWAAGDLPHSYGTGSHAFNYSNNASGKASVKDPSGVFVRQLKTCLSREGIGIGDTSVPASGKTLLLTHSSPELREIMRSCMMRSDNLFAETSLRLFGKAVGGDGSTPDAAARERDFWKGRKLDLSGINIVDGSGLSRSNRMTARFMESVLREKSGDVEYVSFFPLAGQEGTLRKFLAGSDLDSYIAMKTGSMNGIQCYAGYKLDDEFAPTHVVVVMVNDFRCDRAYLRAQVEKMLLSIFSDENMTDRTFSTSPKKIGDY